MTDHIQDATAALEQARAERDKLPQGEARQAMNRALDRVEVAISKTRAAPNFRHVALHTLSEAKFARFAALVLEEAAKVCDIKPGTEPWQVYGGEPGAELCESLAEAIRAMKPVAT